MKKPLSRSTIRREYRACDRRLAQERNLTDLDRGILFGGRQAMGWMLRNNCTKPSRCVSNRG
jgi:hypothetical protein